MAHTAPTSPLFCLQLQAGRRVWEQLPRVADIMVTEGSIVVHQRVLLAGMWVHLPVVVRAGEQFRVGAGGWVEMEARSGAKLHVTVVPAWWRVLLRLPLRRAKNQLSEMPQAV